MHIPRITYQPIPDSTVRLANLQSGALEMVQTIEPDDMPGAARPPAARRPSDELGYQSITFNIGNGARAGTPLGRDPRVRAAFELAIDREAINQVVYEGAYTLTAQPRAARLPFHVADLAAGARRGTAPGLLREAGVAAPVPVEMTVPNNPDLRQVAEVIQAMVKEAGFELRINAMEFASSLQAAKRGEFETYLVGWSGRVDPDGNTWTFMHTPRRAERRQVRQPGGGPAARRGAGRADVEKRRALYAQVLAHRRWAGPQPDLPVAPQEHRRPHRPPPGLRAGAGRADPAAGAEAAIGRARAGGCGCCAGSGRWCRRC